MILKITMDFPEYERVHATFPTDRRNTATNNQALTAGREKGGQRRQNYTNYKAMVGDIYRAGLRLGYNECIRLNLEENTAQRNRDDQNHCFSIAINVQFYFHIGYMCDLQDTACDALEGAPPLQHPITAAVTH